MKSAFARLAVLVVISLACPMFAQDSHYRPDRQQIPSPGLSHHERRVGRRLQTLHAA